MKKILVQILSACLSLFCLSVPYARAGRGQTGTRQQAEARQETEEQQETDEQDSGSRELEDPFYAKRRQSGRQSKRRKYQRVGVADSSADALKLRRPQHATAVASTRRRKPTPVKPGTSWQPMNPDSAEQVGLTLWRLRKCTGASPRCFQKLCDDRGRSAVYEAVRVTADGDFRLGDGVQLAVESPVSGFVYVVHQEVYSGGRTGDPKLLFPLREGDNAVGPGRPLLVPAQTDECGVTVLKMQNVRGRDLTAERLKIIFTRRPLEGVFVDGRPRSIGRGDVSLWDSEWSGRLELFDLPGGERARMSLDEWGALRRDGARDLTTEDLSPQKLYVVERKRGEGVLITLELPYGS